MGCSGSPGADSTGAGSGVNSPAGGAGAVGSLTVVPVTGATNVGDSLGRRVFALEGRRGGGIAAQLEASRRCDRLATKTRIYK